MTFISRFGFLSIIFGAALLSIDTAIAKGTEEARDEADLQIIERTLAERPDIYSGLTVDRAQRFVVVRSVHAQQQLARQLLHERRLDHEQRWTVYVSPVRYSQQHLENVREAVLAPGSFREIIGDVLSSDCIDSARNAVVIGVTHMDQKIVALAKRLYGDAVQIVQEDNLQLTSRISTTAPYFAGMYLKQDTGSIIHYGSSGFVVHNRDNGYMGMLTAGHVFEGTGGILGAILGGAGPVRQKNNTIVATLVAPRWYKNGGLDLAVMSGKTYTPFTYVDGPGSSNYRVVGHPITVRVGDRVCYSGAVTGEACDQEVETLDKCMSYRTPDNVSWRTCHLTSTISYGPAIVNVEGDSGGPVYRRETDGVNPVGIIIGKTSNPARSYFQDVKWIPTPWEIDFIPFE